MEDINIALFLICCGAYKQDRIVRDFSAVYGNDCESALRGYSDICETLFSRDISLSDYFFELAVDAGSPMLKRYLLNRSEALLKAIECDLSVLSRLASIGAEAASAYLRKKFSIPESVCFPLYERGSAVITVEKVLDYAKRFGSSVFRRNKAFRFEAGKLIPAENFDPIRLGELKKYHIQRKRIVDNTLCLLAGKKAQNALLYGDRGTGKSSTVKALVNEFPELRIVQIAKTEISLIYRVYELVKDNPLKFILFIDDISFGDDDGERSCLKQILEGGVVPVPDNCVIYATTNRRHIVKETNSERSGDELHAADARDENMSLADRFGLYLTFSSPGKDEYLDIVRQIAGDKGISVTAETERLAERYALKKCGRSPRTARQFVDILEAKTELKLDYDEI